MKKCTGILLVVVLALSFITGCNIITGISSQPQIENSSAAALSGSNDNVPISSSNGGISSESFTQIRSESSPDSFIGSSLENSDQTSIGAGSIESLPLSQGSADVTSQTRSTADSTTGALLTVSYIDVGQGDSILIQSPGGRNMLIDAGESSSQTVIYDYLKSKGIKKIDVLVATHPHADHIGSMAFIVSNFEIGKIYMPKAVSTTRTYETLLTTIKSKGLTINSAKTGGTILLGDDSLMFEILAPGGIDYDELNSFSVIIKMKYKSNSFLFTGDAGEETEQEILQSNMDLRADVLKVGHHGSATSSSAAFLKAISPRYAVISVGKDNTYGHPTRSALDRLAALDINVYRTDEGGTVVITSNGQSLTVSRRASVSSSQASSQGAVSVAATTPTEGAASTAGDIIVYKTKTGTKYHLSDCSYLASSKIAIKLSGAKAEGLTACSRCDPPQ